MFFLKHFQGCSSSFKKLLASKRSNSFKLDSVKINYRTFLAYVKWIVFLPSGSQNSNSISKEASYPKDSCSLLFNTHSHRSSASPHRVSADGGPQQEAAQAVLELVTLLSSQVHIRRLADCLTAFPSAGTNFNISPFSLPLNLIETVET